MTATTPRSRLTGLLLLPLAASLLLCLLVSGCYLVRPDAGAIITVFPAWSWAVPGLLLAAMGFSRRTRRPAALVALAWCGYLAGFAEETRSVLRRDWPTAEWEAARRQGRALRVVSLNCAGGDPRAAAEVAAYRPDVVLLQESPNRVQVKRLARELFGGEGRFVWGFDASLIVRGELVAAEQHPRLHLVWARAKLHAGPEMAIASVRLHSPAYEMNILSRADWRRQAANRRARREEARELATTLAALPASLPVILGGDFNAPAGDAIYRYLKPRLHEAFRGGGRGWGNTGFNHLPLLRVDEVWVSEHFRASGVVARRTRFSDHRMVVCDLVLR